MVKTYTNISSLMAGLQQELRSAMTEISLQGLMKKHMKMPMNFMIKEILSIINVQVHTEQHPIQME